VPITSGPNRGRTSSAAGRYQFLFSTWKNEQRQLNLPDFSPQSQDKAAWHLAQTVYHRQTNGNLLSDLKNGIFDKVGPALHGTWTSLPGGIEQGANANRFVNNYTRNLTKYT
jgi:muramidase (phage lysozyme)